MEVDWESPAMIMARRSLKSDRRVLAMLGEWWLATDADGNGTIDREEYIELMKAMCVPWLWHSFGGAPILPLRSSLVSCACYGAAPRFKQIGAILATPLYPILRYRVMVSSHPKDETDAQRCGHTLTASHHRAPQQKGHHPKGH